SISSVPDRLPGGPSRSTPGGLVPPPHRGPCPAGSGFGNFFCGAALGTIRLVDLTRGGLFRVHVSSRSASRTLSSPLCQGLDRKPERRRRLCGRHPGGADIGTCGAQRRVHDAACTLPGTIAYM